MNPSSATIPRENTDRLAQIAAQQGMAVFGVAELDPIRQTFYPDFEKTAAALSYGVVMGFRLSDPVLDSIADRPTLIYKHHYKVANYMLDRAAAMIQMDIQKMGFSALPVPASQVVDWKKNLGHLSHKAVAVQAGLGWIGRSALFIHPAHRARLRLCTVLTNMPLSAGTPQQGTCGACRRCIDTCPAGAISEAGYDRQHCADKLKEFSRMPGIGQSICGVCVKVC